MEEAQNREYLINVFRENDHALLYESGMFKKSLQQLELGDKLSIIQELKESLLYNAWPAILQLKQGLQNLGILTIIKSNPQLVKGFFLFRASNCVPW